MRDDDTTPGTARPEAADDRLTAEELDRLAVEGRVRRAPRYRRFVVVGILLGLVSALVVVLALGTSGAQVSRATVMPFVAVGLALVGAVLGAVVAVLLDRARR